MNYQNGIFSNYGTGIYYVALSQAPQVAGIPAHEITTAVSDGRLPVHKVSGCKAVTVADLLKLRGGRKACR